MRITMHLNATVNATVTLDLDDDLDATVYAWAHSPVMRRWSEYPKPMRDAWRLRLGSGWAAQLMLPPAMEPLTPELEPGPAVMAEDGPSDPPVRDDRPADPPPVPMLPPAGAADRHQWGDHRNKRQAAAKRPAPAGGLPF